MLTHAKGLAHVSIFVKDYDETIDFYCNKLGFKLIWDKASNDPKNGNVHLAFLELGNLQLELKYVENAQPLPPMGSIKHVAIAVDDIEKAYEEIVSMGLEPWDIETHDDVLNGISCFILIGPNGEMLEFNQAK